MSANKLPKALQEIVDDFALADRREKLDLLLQYAESLPPLPERYQGKHEELESVPECMTPVFIALETDDEGRLHYYFDIPPNSPTVRGLAAILYHGLNGATPEDVLAVPADFYYQTGLQDAISHQRLNGFAGMLAHVKRLAAKALESRA
nr:SufE family protein [Ardenticatena sp.]